MRTHAGQVMMSFSLGCLPPTGTFVPAPLHSVASGTPRTAHGGSRGCIGWRCRRRHARTQSSVRGHRPNTLLPGSYVGHGALLALGVVPLCLVCCLSTSPGGVCATWWSSTYSPQPADTVGRQQMHCVTQGGRGADGAVMAADPALSLDRIAGAMRSFFAALSEPDTPPEFDGLQVRS